MSAICSLGQFLEDEPLEREAFRLRPVATVSDEAAYLAAAYDRVPRWSREKR